MEEYAVISMLRITYLTKVEAESEEEAAEIVENLRPMDSSIIDEEWEVTDVYPYDEGV